jgi:starch synthase
MSLPSPPSGLKVLFVSPEIAPLAKTGGLGDVAGALPPALRALGLDVRLVMPFYRQVAAGAHAVENSGLELTVAAAGRNWTAQVFTTELGGCPVYLLGNEELFGRDGLYGPGGGDYWDNPTRFTFFCRAVIELAWALDWPARVVHANDWQTALLPALLETRACDPGPLAGAATVLTIHNLAYQGIYDRAAFGVTGLPRWLDSPIGLEFWGNVSLLKAGLVTARALTTVSPTYAREITTPEGGHGLEGVLAQRGESLHGILNGADYRAWSPEADPLLPAAYSARDMAGKTACRDELLRAFALDKAGKRTAVLGFVGRLAYQKGVDILIEAASRLLLDDLRLCVLGTGDPEQEAALAALAAAHKGRVGVRLAFDEGLAHLLTAGCDILAMPSRYEPCGLNQIYALRYGTPPVVREVGGLKDTVRHFDPLTGQGTGFTFLPFQAGDLLCAVREALWTRERPALWDKVRRNAMAQDFSWQKSAQAYAALYASLLGA